MGLSIGESEHKNFALHIKIIYFLVVILILGEIGAYYYSLYLFRSVQEDCVSCTLNRVQVTSDELKNVDNNNNNVDDLILPKYNLRKADDKNNFDFGESRTVENTDDDYFSSSVEEAQLQPPPLSSDTAGERRRYRRQRKKLITSSESHYDGNVPMGRNDFDDNIEIVDDDDNVFGNAKGKKTTRRRDVDNGSTDYYDDDVNSWGQRRKRTQQRQKRAGRRREVNSEAAVEFIPKKDGSPVDKNWVWLTSYSRIPVSAMQDFCKASKEYCHEVHVGQPGPQGNPGEKGAKGDQGDLGFTGDRGSPGAPGAPGPVGPTGPKGDSGVDGLDGFQGAPGLDGVPGIDGINGLNGIPGTNGTNGEPGIPGIPGTNGMKGAQGLMGHQGAQGTQGLPGPKGNRGKDGKDGRAGLSGICAYGHNNTRIEAGKLLVAPSIVDKSPEKNVTVDEGGNAQLHCSATGNPTPIYMWKRENNSETMISGSWRLTSANGAVLEFPSVHREHSGRYVCIASNGIPHEDRMIFNLEVIFPPYITIKRTSIVTSNGKSAFLECEIEAYPMSVDYWSTEDGIRIEDNQRYKTNRSANGYKIYKTLNITNINRSDYRRYTCTSKNSLGSTSAFIEIYELDESLPRIPGQNISYGQAPPPHVELPNLCPIAPPCPTCPPLMPLPNDRHCAEIDKRVYLESYRLGPNKRWKELRNRTKNCLLDQVGTPVYNRYTSTPYGTWMTDPLPTHYSSSAEKYWATYENDSSILYEYANFTAYSVDNATKIYRLQFPFRGNSHVIYNGSFYYHHSGSDTIVRYNLNYMAPTGNMTVYNLTYEGDYLYTTRYNYIDFAIDEDGTWLIYSSPGSNNTIVVRFDPVEMQEYFMWNISLNHRAYGEMFIVCGVLYAVPTVNEVATVIVVAYDLYKNHAFEVSIPFSNPFKRNTMIGYNPTKEILYSWDNGHQLTYPIKFMSMEEVDTTKPIGTSSKVTEIPNDTV